MSWIGWPAGPFLGFCKEKHTVNFSRKSTRLRLNSSLSSFVHTKRTGSLDRAFSGWKYFLERHQNSGDANRSLPLELMPLAASALCWQLCFSSVGVWEGEVRKSCCVALAAQGGLDFTAFGVLGLQVCTPSDLSYCSYWAHMNDRFSKSGAGRGWGDGKWGCLGTGCHCGAVQGAGC